MKAPTDELQALLDNSARRFALLFQRIVKAEVTHDGRAMARAERELGRLLSRSQALADMLGRRRLLLEVDAIGRKKRSAFQQGVPGGRQPVLPDVTFEEALVDLIEREPRLARGWREVQRIYVEEHGFALARSLSVRLTRRVQEKIATALAFGDEPPKTHELIAQMGDFSRAYAETVYRTNITTAYAAGRLREAANPELQNVIAGLRFVAVLDTDVRPNHEAAHGVVARVEDPVWNVLSPPLGYNCRCTLELVDVFDAGAFGLLGSDGRLPPGRVPSGAGPDPGFLGGRADRSIYGG